MSNNNIKVGLSKQDENPILISIKPNTSLGVERFDVEFVIGNFPTEHSARAASNKLVRMVEKELGSKRTKPFRPN